MALPGSALCIAILISSSGRNHIITIGLSNIKLTGGAHLQRTLNQTNYMNTITIKLDHEIEVGGSEWFIVTLASADGKHHKAKVFRTIQEAQSYYDDLVETTTLSEPKRITIQETTIEK